MMDLTGNIDIGSRVRRKSNGDTGTVAGRVFRTESGKDAVMVKWDNKIASPITVTSLEKIPHG